MTITRQQKRANERRADKPAPSEVARTSIRHMGLKTKGVPFSRAKLVKILPSSSGKPAVFVTKSFTRKSAEMHTVATIGNIDWFVSVPDNLKSALLGYV